VGGDEYPGGKRQGVFITQKRRGISTSGGGNGHGWKKKEENIEYKEGCVKIGWRRLKKGETYKTRRQEQKRKNVFNGDRERREKVGKNYDVT